MKRVMAQIGALRVIDVFLDFNPIFVGAEVVSGRVSVADVIKCHGYNIGTVSSIETIDKVHISTANAGDKVAIVIEHPTRRYNAILDGRDFSVELPAESFPDPDDKSLKIFFETMDLLLEKNELETVKQRILNGVIPVDMTDDNGGSLLFWCVEAGHIPASKMLLELGANPNLKDEDGRSPTYVAVLNGDVEMTKVLAAEGGRITREKFVEGLDNGRKTVVACGRVITRDSKEAYKIVA